MGNRCCYCCCFDLLPVYWPQKKVSNLSSLSNADWRTMIVVNSVRCPSLVVVIQLNFSNGFMNMMPAIKSKSVAVCAEHKLKQKWLKWPFRQGLNLDELGWNRSRPIQTQDPHATVPGSTWTLWRQQLGWLGHLKPHGWESIRLASNDSQPFLCKDQMSPLLQLNSSKVFLFFSQHDLFDRLFQNESEFSPCGWPQIKSHDLVNLFQVWEIESPFVWVQHEASLESDPHLLC